MDHRDVVVVASSRGGLPVLRALVTGLPEGFPVPICIVQHIGRNRSILPELLTRWGRLDATHALHGERPHPGRIYVAPPDRHLVLRGGRLHLLDTAAENYARPAADPLFRSAAREYGPGAIGVVLSGDLDDGSAGLAAIRAHGGYGIVQHPDECEAPSMPRAALAAAGADAVATADELAHTIHAAVYGARGEEGRTMTDLRTLDDESRIAEGRFLTPQLLDAIGERSALTCPSCSGALWRMRDDRPLRYRCHTGHAFSALSLDDAEAQKAEDAIWVAIRAVNERMIFARERQEWARRTGNAEDEAIEQARIDENRQLADVLRHALHVATHGREPG
ncbi:chemotaxis protein CheB [Burkholderia multivorans]|uniref:protein-glutamate methylesterase n=1 Tax=Burkholderia multivorans TaxID=87883 RepID=A0ABD7L8R4_9BURK|nr:chemotaxis protein CheB [Burkholderia multivorans]MBR8241754.1 chemotaxis protein CheB [Burkholderia multivorans]MBR8453411.1 chemotaxis protein CheB [Burkholderia multivorans]MBU9449879.1 chemotaxis protein CheB [Burkholderia multivorans]MCL4643613.1 chemotaxis protein CheB [Burkholderia multivorans]MDN7944743.1 chemotaxis protein CheB [Burkholderia multivorans]